jgi:hypothetical protein
MKINDRNKWGGIFLYLIRDSKLEIKDRVDLAQKIMKDLDSIENSANHCRLSEAGGLLDSLSRYMQDTNAAFVSLPEDERTQFGEELQRFEGNEGYGGGLWEAIEKTLTEFCGCRSGKEGYLLTDEPVNPIVGDSNTIWSDKPNPFGHLGDVKPGEN